MCYSVICEKNDTLSNISNVTRAQQQQAALVAVAACGVGQGEVLRFQKTELWTFRLWLRFDKCYSPINGPVCKI